MIWSGGFLLEKLQHRYPTGFLIKLKSFKDSQNLGNSFFWKAEIKTKIKQLSFAMKMTESSQNNKPEGRITVMVQTVQSKAKTTNVIKDPLMWDQDWSKNNKNPFKKI